MNANAETYMARRYAGIAASVMALAMFPAFPSAAVGSLLGDDAFRTTYRALPSVPIAIVGATVLTATGEQIDNGTVLIRDGKIEAVAAALEAPAGYRRIDGAGRWVTPGIVEIHGHVGVKGVPSVAALTDNNEMTDPNTANVWAEHSLWPQDPGLFRARENGVTTLQLLPGSANLFGGRTVVIKNVPARIATDMKFPGAPYGLKMACGENPKRVYGARARLPSTRMGEIAAYRAAWIEAERYRRKWDEYAVKTQRGEVATMPDRDLRLETLAAALRGDIRVHVHCYRADDMANLLAVAKEFGFKIAAFHHAVEAYKIADVLAANGVAVATWAGWWGQKLEFFDAIEENIGLVQAAGGSAMVHSDSPETIQHLNLEAAVALSAARRMGLDISRAEAVKWFTANPARALGVFDRTGSLEAGKMADVVVWDRDPFSVYALTQLVLIDGAVIFDRNDSRRRPTSDFMVGQMTEWLP